MTRKGILRISPGTVPHQVELSPQSLWEALGWFEVYGLARGLLLLSPITIGLLISQNHDVCHSHDTASLVAGSLQMLG